MQEALKSIFVFIPVLNPERSFFSSVVSKLQSQTICIDLLLINSGNPIDIGEYEVIVIDKQDFNHANTRNLALKYDTDFYLVKNRCH